ncbi:hypothetical protein IFM89_017100 [Coptis chinensis]|uniref:DUF4283 domain-containing protein n=1 Tax=Coptis chinensis TaxID=261450 RepID=A0A835M9Z3_9MAGN|nr:hypothetical protein IFM89_017100 [Coptis chinensis]
MIGVGKMIGTNTNMRSEILERRSTRWNKLIEVYVYKSSVSNSNTDKESDGNKLVHSLMMRNYEVDIKKLTATKKGGGIKSSVETIVDIDSIREVFETHFLGKLGIHQLLLSQFSVQIVTFPPISLLVFRMYSTCFFLFSANLKIMLLMIHISHISHFFGLCFSPCFSPCPLTYISSLIWAQFHSCVRAKDLKVDFRQIQRLLPADIHRPDNKYAYLLIHTITKPQSENPSFKKSFQPSLQSDDTSNQKTTKTINTTLPLIITHPKLPQKHHCFSLLIAQQPHLFNLMEDITHVLAQAHLTGSKEDFFVMEIPRNLLLQTSARWNSSLIGKIFTETKLDPNEVMRAIRGKWNLKQRLHILAAEGGRFILSFENEIDKEKILKNEPWQIMGYLFALKDFNPENQPNQVTFKTSLFWINFTGLQLEHQSPSVIKLIAAAAGIVKEIDPPDTTPRDATGYRARVEVDLYKPMRQGTMTETFYMGPTWIDFVYTGIPYHSCKSCHRFTHDTNNCDGAPPTVTELLRITGISPVVEPILFQERTTTGIYRSGNLGTVGTTIAETEATQQHNLCSGTRFQITTEEHATPTVEHITAIGKVANAPIRKAAEQISKLPDPQVCQRFTIPIPNRVGMDISSDVHLPKPIKISKPKPTRRKNPKSQPTTSLIDDNITLTEHIQNLISSHPQKKSKQQAVFPPSSSRQKNKGKLSTEDDSRPNKKKRSNLFKDESNQYIPPKYMEENFYTPLIPPQTIPSPDQIPIEFLETIANNQMESMVNNQFQNLRLSELSTEAVWDIIHSPMVSQLLLSKGLMIKSAGAEQEWTPSNQHLYGELQYDMRNNEFELYQNDQWAETGAEQMSIESQIPQTETTKILQAETNPLNLRNISEDPSLLPMSEIGSASSSHRQVQIPNPYYYCFNNMADNIMICCQACYHLIHLFKTKPFISICANKHKLCYRSERNRIVEDRRAIRWCPKNTSLKLQVELESKAAVDYLGNKLSNLSWTAQLILSDAANLFKFFGSVDINYVPKSGNLVAHNLAAAASTNPQYKNWTLNPPNNEVDIQFSFPIIPCQIVPIWLKQSLEHDNAFVIRC